MNSEPQTAHQPAMSDTGSPSTSANPFSDDRAAEEASTPITEKAYVRIYVACATCRARKVKCIIGALPPCAKCQREHRDCVFDDPKRPQKRPQKRRKPSVWLDPESGSGRTTERPSKVVRPRSRSPELSTNEGYNLPSRDVSTAASIAVTGQNEVVAARASTQPLTDKVIRGVVAKPGDALNLLFDAS